LVLALPEVLAERQVLVLILFFHLLRLQAVVMVDITAMRVVMVVLAAAAVHKLREFRLVELELLGKVLLGATEILLPHIQLVVAAVRVLLE
jgi:hypothetical protein